MKKLILIIDDSPTIRTVLEFCLQRAGYETLCFPDGIEAMGWMTQGVRMVDLILLDLWLPKLDGFEVARRIKQHVTFSALPIIMLSCQDGRLMARKARLAGASAYLSKPFTVQQVLKAVTSALGGSTHETVTPVIVP